MEKKADKQQDVNYTAAVKSTLHVGLKLSTVNREECQTTVLETASESSMCVCVCVCVCVCMSVCVCVYTL